MIRVRMRKCVRVCVLVCWNPTSIYFQFLLFFALHADAVSCRLYHTVPQQVLKLSNLWQPRYNSGRTAS